MDSNELILLPIPEALFWSIAGGLAIIIGALFIKWLWRTATAKSDQRYSQKPSKCSHIAYVKAQDDGTYFVSPSVVSGPVDPLLICYNCGVTFHGVDHANTVVEASFQNTYRKVADRVKRDKLPLWNLRKWRL